MSAASTPRIFASPFTMSIFGLYWHRSNALTYVRCTSARCAGSSCDRPRACRRERRFNAKIGIYALSQNIDLRSIFRG